MINPITGSYLEHMRTTGLVTGFQIHSPQPPHDDLAAALVAILQGALPDSPVADQLRRLHTTDLDAAELDAFFTWAPAWGRVLTLVQDPARAAGDSAERYQMVRAALARWRLTL